MKTLINKFLGFGALLTILVACKKEPTLTVMQEVSFPSLLTASQNNVLITESNASSALINFTWPKVSYPIDAPVSYTLQIDVASDTTGASAWGKATNIEVGEDILLKSLNGAELNTMAISLGLKPNESGKLVARIKSVLDRPAYSNNVSFTVTPYKVFTSYPSLWLPGNYQGWNPAVAPKIVSVNSDKVFEGYVDLETGEFKLTAQPNWEPMAYGDGSNETLIEANFAGGNFNAATSGNYFIYANLNTMKYKFINTSWGIIGDATPGGWNSDTDLTYSTSAKKWTVTLNLTSTGSFKFRANDGWAMAMGVKDGKLAYSDNPVYPYDAAVTNFSVTETGNYTVTLDFSEPGNYTYKLTKN